MTDLNALRAFVAQELQQDRAYDDVTCRLLGEKGSQPARAVVYARQPGVYSGEAVTQSFPADLEVRSLVREGASVEKGEPLVELRGTVIGCLTLERTLLNFVSHLSGVASLTRRFVEAVRPHRAKILATRKTLPGLRDLQLTAVRSGGGFVHRRSLSDGILVKENHLRFMGEAEAVERARKTKSPLHRVEVEVQDLDVLERLLKNPPDVIMLDNFDLEQMREALRRINGQCETEASGGMTLDRVGEVAALGVDYISVGCLTHSAVALDVSMDFVGKDE